MAIVGTTVAATAAGAAAKTGIWAAVKAFFVKNGAAVATTATTAALALSGNSFEGKKHKVSFSKSDPIVTKKGVFRVPRVHYSRVDKSSSYQRSKVSSNNKKQLASRWHSW